MKKDLIGGPNSWSECGDQELWISHQGPDQPACIR